MRVPHINTDILWKRLLTPSFSSEFQGMFATIAIRTSKEIADREMGLPRALISSAGNTPKILNILNRPISLHRTN
jgi:hypothetical protein